MITHESILATVLDYRDKIWIKLQSTDDIHAIEKLGIRFESASRICSELLSNVKEEARLEKLLEPKWK